jgi:hypothetical protein
MSDRYFDRNEAEELLPMIASVLNEARQQKQKMDALDRDLSQAAAKIMVMGGWIPPHRELAEKRVLRDQSRGKVREAIEQIQEIGCVLKDLDEGLVDFPAMLDGHEIYLCWKLGEERIGYWHGLDEGFAGRKPLEGDDKDDEGKSGGPGRLQ